MSDVVYPAAPRGLTFTSTKVPVTDTHLQTSPDKKSVAIPRVADPLWQWSLIYDYLKDYDIQIGELYTDLNTLRGFFLQRYAKEDNFLFTDPDDNTVTLGPLPLWEDTDGTFYSPIQRVFGGFAEDITDLNPDSTESSLQLYANGVLQTSGFTLKGQSGASKAISGHSFGGLYIQWDAAPTPPITASFSFYFRVRFDIDLAEFDKFMDELWELGGSHGGTSSQGIILVGTRLLPQGASPCIGGKPHIDSVSPSFIPDGGPNFTITITGGNFRPDSIVSWNGSPRATVYISPTELQATILSTDIVDPGTYFLQVNNPSPGCGLSDKFPYIVKPVVRFEAPGGTTYDWGLEADQSLSDVVLLFEDAYTNYVYIVDSGLPAYTKITGDLPAVRAWDELDSTAEFTNGETVTVNGVVYTIVSGAFSAPFQIAIGTGAADTFANLLAAIQGTGTPGTEYSVGTTPSSTVGGGASSSGSNYIYLEANTAGTAGNSITVSTTAAHATWENSPTFAGGLDARPEFIALWTSLLTPAISPNGHIIAGSFQIPFSIIARAVFTGSGLDTMTSGGNYTATANKVYTVTIDPGGTTFTWDDGFMAVTHVPITGTAQDLNDGVQVTFGATMGYTWMDSWQFTAYAPAIKLRSFDVGYHPTLVTPGTDSSNGPSSSVSATQLQDFDYPASRISEVISFPAYKNIEIVRATGSLVDGSRPACNATMTVISATIRNGGTLFTAGDNCLIYGRDAVFHIDTVGGGGVALTGHITAGGTQYVTAINVPCTGGTGSGLILDIVGDYDENFNFGANLTNCDALQECNRQPMDLEADDNGDLYVLDYDTRTGGPATPVNTVASACVATHGQETWPTAEFGNDGEISELFWDQVNLAKLPAGSSTLADLGSFLMRYRVCGNFNIEDINTEPCHTSRLRYFGSLPYFVFNGGSGYLAGQWVNPVGGTTPATLQIDTVDGTGKVLTMSVVLNGTGWGYVPNYNSFQSTNVATVGGSGTGLTVNFTLGGPVHTNTRTSTQYRELLASPRIWDGASSQIIAIANAALDYTKFVTDPLRTSSKKTAMLGIIVPNNGGANYKRLDNFNIAGGGVGTVYAVDGTGKVTACGVITPASGYAPATGVATTGGSGTGLTIDILAVQDDTTGQITHAGGMAILEPTAITQLNYRSSSQPAYFDKILVGNWSMDIGFPPAIDNPDPTHIGSRPQQIPTFVAYDPVASQYVTWQNAPFTPTSNNWQWTGLSTCPSRTADHVAIPYNQIDSGGAITAVKVMVDGAVKSVTDSNPSGHALQFPTANTILFNKAGWSAVTDSDGSGNGGERTAEGGSSVTIESSLEPVSPAGLISDTLVTLSGGIMVATVRRPT